MDVYDDEDLYWTVPVKALALLTNPMRDNIWGCGEITPEDVMNCPDNSLGNYPLDADTDGYGDWDYHVARISWLLENGWDTAGKPAHPISIDLYPDAIYDWHPLTDGNHRFCAALLAGKETLLVSISGDIDYAYEVLQPLDAEL